MISPRCYVLGMLVAPLLPPVLALCVEQIMCYLRQSRRTRFGDKTAKAIR